MLIFSYLMGRIVETIRLTMKRVQPVEQERKQTAKITIIETDTLHKVPFWISQKVCPKMIL